MKKTAIVIRVGEEIKVRVSEVEKPNGEEYYEEHQVAVDEVDQIFNNELYQSDLLKWQQSFKEYSVKDSKEWDKYLRLTYGNNINLALSKGIDIDPSLVRIEECFIEKTPYELDRDYKAYCGHIGYKETGFKSVGMLATVTNPTIKEVKSFQDESDRITKERADLIIQLAASKDRVNELEEALKTTLGYLPFKEYEVITTLLTKK